MTTTHHVTQLLEDASAGSREAAEGLFAIVYDELRRLAGSQLGAERSDHTLQSTALVHEVWLKLIGGREDPAWNNRAHFYAAAAQAMRRILVDSARARGRQKRGGGMVKLELQEHDWIYEDDEQLLALDEALEQLREVDEPKARLVELRYFAGLTNAEAATQLGISTATAERHWAYSRAWLKGRMTED